MGCSSNASELLCDSALGDGGRGRTSLCQQARRVSILGGLDCDLTSLVSEMAREPLPTRVVDSLGWGRWDRRLMLAACTIISMEVATRTVFTDGDGSLAARSPMQGRRHQTLPAWQALASSEWKGRAFVQPG